MDEQVKAELAAKLQQMDAAALDFYAKAQRLGVHPFLEFCGLMREYVQLCRAALDADIDFSHVSRHHGSPSVLPFTAFHASYLGEKFGCIFAPWLSKPEFLHAFLQSAGASIDAETTVPASEVPAASHALAAIRSA